MTFLLVGFLLAHGLIHLAIWLPHPAPDPDKPPPFEPDHSGVLTAVHAPPVAAHRLSVTLAGVAAAAYVVAGIAVALGASWAVPFAVLAAVAGILLKLVFFSPWLTVGLLLDAGVLAAASYEWLVTLS